MKDYRSRQKIKEQNEREIFFAKRQLKDQVVTIKHLGWKPHLAKQSIQHIQVLLKHKVIDLTKDADGVRCFMEIKSGALSQISHAYIISLLDAEAEQKLIKFIENMADRNHS